MDTKLEQLTQKLYDEGLAKGRAEGERMEKEATEKAKKIVADAQSKAAEIVQKATAQAEELRKNTLSEIALAGRQAVAKIRSEIAGSVVAKTVEKAVGEANADAEFIKQILIEVAKNWSPDSRVDLVALLPEARRAKFDKAFAKSANELLKAGIEVGYSADVCTGFRVAPKAGGYYVDFSDESFNQLLGGYLREKVVKLLF